MTNMERGILMLVNNRKNLYGVYWTSGISSILMGIYESESYDYVYDVFEQFAQDNNYSDFAEFIMGQIDDNKYYQDELDKCESEIDYDDMYTQFQDELYNEYSVQPIHVEFGKDDYQ